MGGNGVSSTEYRGKHKMLSFFLNRGGKMNENT